MPQITAVGLTPAQARFVEGFIKYNSATKAIRYAFPDTWQELAPDGLKVKGHRMLTNVNVQMAIADQKKRMEQIAARATERVGQIVESEDESVALNASKFAIEQVHGKARQITEVSGVMVEVKYDLSGGNSEAIPQAVLDELAANNQS